MMTIHFNANLHPVVQEKVGMLHWIMDPLVAGFIIGYDLSGNQVLICNFDVSPEARFKGSMLTIESRKSIQQRVGQKNTVARLLILPSGSKLHMIFSASGRGF